MIELVRGAISSLAVVLSFGLGLNLPIPVWSAERPRDLVSEIRNMSQNSQTVRNQDIQKWLERADTILPKFNNIDLALSLHSLSKLKKYRRLTDSVPASFIEAWTNSALSKMDTFKSQELSNSLYAFGVLEIHPSDPFLQAWQRKAQDSIGSFNPQGLSNSLYAFAVLGIHPSDPFLQAWQRKAQESIDSFKPQELSNSLYAFAVLGIHPSDPFLQAWQRKAIEIIRMFKPQGNHQLLLAKKILFAKFKIVLPLQLTLHLNKAQSRFKNQKPTSSNSQKRIARDISTLYPEDLQEEYWSEATASYVDFAVPSAKVVIQFDGPHHFQWINGHEVLSAQDQAMDFILRNEGWTVFRISYRDWERIRNRPQSERISELKKILGQP